ncbi:hypothetical protein [Deinococcus yavapaiensis]|uniref:Sensory transduction regulator n=1 Tax=Deinococcus yavapaiensis KR-236 TaxID=694435 RepID=A0A318SAP4_9DEIO|nr:hypothetical protein [Deinococcus yavapaiensis]PYE56439.1 hypothetical protein DES52_101243 [Deinococcus yavapaiensis KR-236]
MTEIERLIEQLARRGHDVERVEDGALYPLGDTHLALFAVPAESGDGLVVRAHLDLDLYVDEEVLADVLLGVNLLNQNLDFGTLVLDPVESDDDDTVTFAVLGRASVWLRDFSESEIARLEAALERFEAEVSGAVERSLSSGQHLKA